jgi:hypothetical protein
MTQAVTLSPSPKMQFFTAAGVPLVGGKLFTYASGTTTVPLATYTDSTGNTANANPVILRFTRRSKGMAWPFSLHMVLKDSLDNLIWTAAALTAAQAFKIHQ